VLKNKVKQNIYCNIIIQCLYAVHLYLHTVMAAVASSLETMKQ